MPNFSFNTGSDVSNVLSSTVFVKSNFSNIFLPTPGNEMQPRSN
jgi:hypothetical protein